MASKLLHLLVNNETCNKLPALEQARGVINRGGSKTAATSKIEL